MEMPEEAEPEDATLEIVGAPEPPGTARTVEVGVGTLVAVQVGVHVGVAADGDTAGTALVAAGVGVTAGAVRPGTVTSKVTSSRYIPVTHELVLSTSK